jgi:hypothetical protein
VEEGNMTSLSNGLRASLRLMPLDERAAFIVELLVIIRAEVVAMARECAKLSKVPKPKRPKPARRGAIRRRQ